MLKISCWSDMFFDQKPEDAVKILSESGFEVMDLSILVGARLLARSKNVEKTGREFKRYMDDLGFSAPQGHLTLEGDVCVDDPTALLDELKSWIELLRESGVKNLVFHSGGFNKTLTSDERLTRRVKAIEQLLPSIEGGDCCLCLENLVTAIPSSDELVKTIEAVGSKNLGICWDVGHLNLTRTYSVLETPEHFVEVAGKYIKALHIADNDGRTDQHLIPNVLFDKEGFSSDPTKIDLCLITKLLKKIGYKGLYNFEVPGEIKAPLEIRKNKTELIKLIGEFYLEKLW